MQYFTVSQTGLLLELLSERATAAQGAKADTAVQPAQLSEVGQAHLSEYDHTLIHAPGSDDQDLSGLLPLSHLTDFAHADISHANRVALDLVSGTNTGDQDLSGLLPNTHLTDFTHADIAHTNRTALDLVSGTNTGDQSLAGLVPYTGATDDVNLGTHNLSAGDIQSTNLPNRNAIINGNFDIWQRGTSFTVTGYTADRWRNAAVGGTGTVTQQSVTVGDANNSFYSLKKATSGQSAVGDYSFIEQRIEDGELTFGGKTTTTSFWAKSSVAQNISIEFTQVFGIGGSATVNTALVQKVAITTSWAKYTVTGTLPSIVGKTVGTSNYLRIIFWFSAGSNYDSRTDSLGINNTTVDLAQVQLEEGSVATPFEKRPLAQELALCQRYYEKSGATAVSIPAVSTTQRALFTKFSVTKRTTPTVARTGSSAIGDISTEGFNASVLTNFDSTRFTLDSWTADAEL